MVRVILVIICGINILFGYSEIVLLDDHGYNKRIRAIKQLNKDSNFMKIEDIREIGYSIKIVDKNFKLFSKSEDVSPQNFQSLYQESKATTCLELRDNFQTGMDMSSRWIPYAAFRVFKELEGVLFNPKCFLLKRGSKWDYHENLSNLDIKDFRILDNHTLLLIADSLYKYNIPSRTLEKIFSEKAIYKKFTVGNEDFWCLNVKMESDQEKVTIYQTSNEVKIVPKYMKNVFHVNGETFFIMQVDRQKGRGLYSIFKLVSDRFIQVTDKVFITVLTDNNNFWGVQTSREGFELVKSQNLIDWRLDKSFARDTIPYDGYINKKPYLLYFDKKAKQHKALIF